MEAATCFTSEFCALSNPLLLVAVLICRPCEEQLLVGPPARRMAPMGSAAATLLPAR